MNPVFEVQQHINRRLLLKGAASGIGTAAVASLLAREVDAASSSRSIARSTHFASRAKRVVYLFQSGGPSHLELLDYKPGLKNLHGKELPDSIRQGQRLTGMTSGQKSFPVIAPKFGFRQCGQSGTWLYDCDSGFFSCDDKTKSQKQECH